MASNQANVPVEMIESDYPIRIERYGFAPDTGGAGKYRGGLGVVREYRVLADDIYFGVRSDKSIHPPHGLFGGEAGAPTVNLIRSESGERVLPPMPMKPITLRTGDLYRHVMAGGGGFGDPLDRDPQAVREGKDPQLEKAVELVLAELKKNPPPKYVRPAFPDYYKPGLKEPAEGK